MDVDWRNSIVDDFFNFVLMDFFDWGFIKNFQMASLRKLIGLLMILTALWYFIDSNSKKSSEDWIDDDWDDDLGVGNGDLRDELRFESARCRVLGKEIRHYVTQEEYDFRERCVQEIRNGYGGVWYCPTVWSTRTSSEGYQGWVNLGVVDYLWLNRSIPVSGWLSSRELVDSEFSRLGISVRSEVDCQYHILRDEVLKGDSLVEIVLPGVIVSRC